MSKSKPVVPKVPSAKVLARYSNYLATVSKVSLSDHTIAVSSESRRLMGDIEMNPETKAMLLESARVHDEMEDRSDCMVASALDELSPHARAALNRLLGTPRDPE